MENSSLGVWSLNLTEGRGSNARPVTPPFMSGENDEENGEEEDEGDGLPPPSEATAPLPKTRRSQSATPFIPPVAARFGRAG